MTKWSDGSRIMGRHRIVEVGNPRKPDCVSEIDVSERVRDAFEGDAHRLGSVFGWQGERGL
jgi:hypothetical protein